MDIYYAKEDDKFMAFYAFEIWNALKCSAFVERADGYT